MTPHQKIAEPEKEQPGDAEVSDHLRAYTRKKFALATQLRELLQILKKRKSETRIRRCEELMVKLAEDRFTLAVVGQFKRGKSSLMNAIIGRELLPVGVLPLTSAITVLKYGPTERLVIRRDASPFPEIAPVSAVADYVTQKGNPGNRKKVKTATLELPLSFLRGGLEFVDTPGVGSSIEANTATTYAFLPECDAVVFVTSVDSPFTEAELDFLHAIRNHVAKIFFIVNKTDLLPDQGERDELLRFFDSEIRAEMETQQVRLFPVSSRLALAESESGKPVSHNSGLPELQETLTRFLAQEKSAIFLTSVVEKALRMIDEESGELELYRYARLLPAAALHERLNRVRSTWEELKQERLSLLRDLQINCLQTTRDIAARQLNHFFEAKSDKLSRDLDRIVTRAGWRFGEEVAEHWAGHVAHLSHDWARAWLQDLKLQLQQNVESATTQRSQQIKTNLEKIHEVAAAAFDLNSRPADDLLPSLEVTPVFDQRLESLTFNHPLRWFSFMPTRLIRRLLKAALLEMTKQFIASWREQALRVMSDSVNRMTGEIADQVERAATELQSRLTAAITGEHPVNDQLKQASGGLPKAGWGDNALTAIYDRLMSLRSDTSVPHGAERDVDKPESSELHPTAPHDKRLSGAEPHEPDVENDLTTRGCAVCEHLVKTAYDFLAHWQYAISSDEAAQQKFAKEHGFCPLHMWQLHAVSSSAGESIGLARLVEQTSGLMKQAATEANAPGELPSSLRQHASCRVCHLVRQAEAGYVDRLAAFLAENAGRDLYRKSQGVCLRHLEHLLPHVADDVRKFLLSEAARHFEQAAEDMQNYAVKREALRRHLGNIDEEDAYLRALIHLSGAKDVSTPWPEDGEI